MFLYLSSQGLGPAPHLVVEHARGRRALVIANALDDLAARERASMVADEVAQLAQLGFDADELDLRAYFASTTSLESAIGAVSVLWVIGGNTFTLCRAFDASGAVAPIRDRVARGLVYAGYSAGAVAAGPDLIGIDLVDDPATLPDGYPSSSSPVTLHLIEERVIPHAGDHDAARGVMAPVIERLQHGNNEHLLLKDGQALVVRNSSRWVEST